MSDVSVEGVTLWAEQVGEGPDLVFIAGLGDERDCWSEQAAALQGSYRVTTFDNRGVGRSSTPPGAYEIIDFADDTAKLLDALEIEAAHVVGSSMGGAIAQELALRHPARVRTLVLHGTWCYADRYFREVIRGIQVLARGASTPRDFFIAANVWFLSPELYNSGTIDEWASAYEANPYLQSVDAFTRSAEALLGHDTRDRLGEISCPTLVTVGSEDICTPERYARELVSLIPGARLQILDGAAHMPYVEDPDTFTAVVSDFLRDNARG
jgi:pimeloyl-ACP methyl ester carboxylesterase